MSDKLDIIIREISEIKETLTEIKRHLAIPDYREDELNLISDNDWEFDRLRKKEEKERKELIKQLAEMKNNYTKGIVEQDKALQIWQNTLSQIKQLVSENKYESFFENLNLVECIENYLIIERISVSLFDNYIDKINNLIFNSYHIKLSVIFLTKRELSIIFPEKYSSIDSTF